ncbi:transposase [Acetobacter cibinongensis]|uniref:transposase n=2 Tax=Acetobacter cibinongensis TaxID=146475 RepID=UPI00215683D2|nr:transposase [Acetobacter cibinongensis]GBQ15911.1 transposase [Acetobacter cibinongensis NRIC 0482]
MSNKSKRFPPEFRDRAARMVLEEEKNHPSRWSAVMMIAPKLDIHPDTLSKWTRLHERGGIEEPLIDTLGGDFRLLAI